MTDMTPKEAHALSLRMATMELLNDYVIDFLDKVQPHTQELDDVRIRLLLRLHTLKASNAESYNGLQIVSVLPNCVNYVIDEGTMGTIDFKDIKSLDFSWIVSNNIIQVYGHSDALIAILDNGNRNHKLGEAFETYLHNQTKSK